MKTEHSTIPSKGSILRTWTRTRLPLPPPRPQGRLVLLKGTTPSSTGLELTSEPQPLKDYTNLWPTPLFCYLSTLSRSTLLDLRWPPKIRSHPYFTKLDTMLLLRYGHSHFPPWPSPNLSLSSWSIRITLSPSLRFTKKSHKREEAMWTCPVPIMGFFLW